jgi:hypothetical protein
VPIDVSDWIPSLSDNSDFIRNVYQIVVITLQFRRRHHCQFCWRRLLHIWCHYQTFGFVTLQFHINITHNSAQHSFQYKNNFCFYKIATYFGSIWLIIGRLKRRLLCLHITTLQTQTHVFLQEYLTFSRFLVKAYAHKSNKPVIIPSTEEPTSAKLPLIMTIA